MHPTHTPLMPSELPPLSDASAVQILEFLHELVYRFEARYFVQIRRFHDAQRKAYDDAAPFTPPPDDDEPFDDDLPF